MIRVNVFSWGLVLRVVILLGLSLILGLIFLSIVWIFSQIVISSLIVLATIELIYHVHKTNRDISRLLEGFKYDEHTSSFVESKHPARYSQLHQQMEEIRLAALKKSEERTQAFRLQEKTLELLDEALILFNSKNGKILLQTPAVNRFIGTKSIETIDSFESLLPGFIERVKSSSDIANLAMTNEKYGYKFNQDLRCKVFKFRNHNEPFTLLVFTTQKVGSSTSEFETWINFGKVISHEILNGISPIVSLTDTLKEQVNRIEGNEDRKKSIEKALKIIADRSHSLQNYSEKYRTLHKLPEPEKQALNWDSTLSKSVESHRRELDDAKITVDISGDSLSNVFYADKWQMEQVFSNLLLNSIHAFEDAQTEHPEINIEVDSNELHYIVTFSDNGPGIAKNNRSNVFVPFFTTRDSGSGIGLSVTKQILWKHKAEIFLNDQDVGTGFVIRFPKL